jgi:sugar diacid utilization regulator
VTSETDPGRAPGSDLSAGRLQALEQQNRRLRDLLGLGSRLSGIALQGASLDAITTQFGRLVGRDVLVLDPGLHILAGASAPDAPTSDFWPDADPQLARILATVVEERRPVRIPALPDWKLAGTLVIAPVGVGDELLGYLAIVNPTDVADDDLDLLTVEHAATVFAVALMRERMAAELANRLKEDLLEALLAGPALDAQQARTWASALGYDPQTTYRVMVIMPREPSAPPSDEATALSLWRHLLYALLDALSYLAPRSIGVVRRNDLVALVPAGGGDRSAPSPLALARDLQRLATQRYPAVPISVGLSAACEDPTDLQRSFTQARQAIQLGRLLRGDGDIVDFEQLGLYRLLLQAANPQDLRGYAEQVLGSVLDYDRRHQADFVHTLRSFFAHNASLQAAARDLVVHVNTVAYRMQRIEQISGLDFNQPDDRLAAQLALKILDGLG